MGVSFIGKAHWTKLVVWKIDRRAIDNYLRKYGPSVHSGNSDIVFLPKKSTVLRQSICIRNVLEFGVSLK